MAESSKSNLDSLLGRLVVDQGLASADDVRACRNALGDNSTSLSEMMVKQGLVTQKQLKRLENKVDDRRSSQQIPGFQIIERLGAGAMATVYKAKQLSLDRMVAVKVLPQKFMNNPEFVKRFYAEGKAAARLNHPNIVGALDVGHAGEYHYFVMEYVAGKTVFDDLQDRGVYEEIDALNLVIQIARALEHAHAAGLIHRDVKPKNIMITPEGVGKLADMGLARAVSDREAAEAEKGKAFGTPYYISPEQIRGETDVDFRADIYSLGCTFYHMVTGRVPFDGPNPSVVMHKHLKEDVVAPDHINPSLSAGIGEVIEVCMAKDPKKRYSNTTDLLDDLESLLRGEAPMQARKQFDLASLTALESSAIDIEYNEHVVGQYNAPPLTEQASFWAAIIGWTVAGILLLILVLMLAG